MPRIAIIGPTGYSALELLGILLRHPQAEITYLASRREEPLKISEVFPALAKRCDLALSPIDPDRIAQAADAAFLCLPNGLAMELAPQLLQRGLKVIDFSADYRLREPAEFERVYKMPHKDAARLKAPETVYGLPEFFRDQIKTAKLIANPGCYATAVELAVAPLLQAECIAPADIIANAGSGISGAGRDPKPHLHFAERNETIQPYEVGTHRHQPEIEQTLRLATGEREVGVLFVPHYVPMVRGILATVYAKPLTASHAERAAAAFAQRYAKEPFIRLRKDLPSTRDVAGTNFCDLCVRVVKERIVVVSVIDNLVKGAAGQAVQNLNLMFGLEETMGLE